MKALHGILIAVFTLVLALNAGVAADSNSYHFDVKITGKGKEAIIFIPGFACSGDVWNETKAVFEKDFTCYTLTMAGFAGIPPKSGATFKNWETSIADYIKNNKIASPIIIGHSMGGGLTLALAADYPDLIGKIVVVDALPCLLALMNPAFTAKENPECTEMVNQMVNMSNDQFYLMQKKSMPRLLADTSKQGLVIDWSMTSDRRTFAEMYCNFSNTDLREKIKSIKCPNLILLEASFLNFKSSIDEQYKNLQNANLQFATKGLHFIMFDDKEWYMNQLTNFINTK